MQCTYCDSKEPCFDGITAAGLPCQHPAQTIRLTPEEIRTRAELWAHRIKCINSRSSHWHRIQNS